MLRGSEHRRVFRKLEGDIPSKKQAGKNLQQEERKDRTLRVLLREVSCLIVVAIAYVSVAEQRSRLTRAISVITQMCRRKKI